MLRRVTLVTEELGAELDAELDALGNTFVTGLDPEKFLEVSIRTLFFGIDDDNVACFSPSTSKLEALERLGKTLSVDPTEPDMGAFSLVNTDDEVDPTDATDPIFVIFPSSIEFEESTDVIDERRERLLLLLLVLFTPIAE